LISLNYLKISIIQLKNLKKSFGKLNPQKALIIVCLLTQMIPAILIFKTAMSELIKTKRQSSAVQASRVGRVLEIATDTEMKKVEKNFTFLATVGSTAPFIGLFGTVWGIMNSFPINRYIQKYQFSYCSARNSRSTICNSVRFIGGHTSGGSL
jgi:biopolymer transport protein ExbB/TolQ